MKKILFLLSTCMFLSFSLLDASLSKEEREMATKFLTESKQEIFDAAKGLSDAQLKFSPGPDRWSIEDCLKHIAISEMMLWGLLEGGLKAPATPDRRSELKMKDEEVIKNIESREKKVKTFTPMEPLNTPYKSTPEALASFSKDRDKLIDYVNKTQEDLRNHLNQLPVGMFDSYQMILFIGAHSNRHLQQIKEVKADPKYPKS